MKVVFTELAVNELRDAQAFYDMEFTGLGSRFTNEVRSTIDRIVAHPDAWQVERGEVRRCLLPRFPYKLLYSTECDHVVIIVAHRRPDYWVGPCEALKGRISYSDPINYSPPLNY